MANTNERVRAHNKLVELVKAGPYFAMSYDSNGDAAEIDEAVATQISPVSVKANETGSSFEEDRRHGSSMRRRRRSWDWTVVAKFNQEVAVDAAEKVWLESPPILARTSDFPDQLRVDFLNSSYMHPTTKQPHAGSLIEFNFEIRQSRR